MRRGGRRGGGRRRGGRHGPRQRPAARWRRAPRWVAFLSSARLGLGGLLRRSRGRVARHALRNLNRAVGPSKRPRWIAAIIVGAAAPSGPAPRPRVLQHGLGIDVRLVARIFAPRRRATRRRDWSPLVFSNVEDAILVLDVGVESGDHGGANCSAEPAAVRRPVEAAPVTKARTGPSVKWRAQA